MGQSLLPELPRSGSLPRTSRALTEFYEQALRPAGLRAAQLTILQVLVRAGQVSQGQLGEMPAGDSTSLTRMLAIMVRKGGIDERRCRDRREPWLSLASVGEIKLMRALPVWEQL